MRQSCRSTMKKKAPPTSIIKASFRSPIHKKKDDRYIYKVVTNNVKVPTDNINTSYIPFKTKSVITPIQNVEKLELIKIVGRKRYHFDEALFIYENNQFYYLDLIESNLTKVDSIIKEVEGLERWFCQISEPRPKDEDEVESWQQREAFKHLYQYSKYFNKALLYYFCKN